MKILTVPNPILNQVAKDVKSFDEKLLKLIDELSVVLNAQNDPPGTGISAPQVGISQKIFLSKLNQKAKITPYINPEIIKYEYLEKKRKSKKIPLEGCLSVPKIWGEVKRYDKILMKYQDLNGKTIEEWFTGFEAVVIQHEYDHLLGILFTQRVLEQGNCLYDEIDGELIKKKI